MPSVYDLRFTDLFTSSTPINEPLNAQRVFEQKLTRFGDNYNTNVDSRLYRFLSSLCGEAGAGSLKKNLLIPRLQQALESTYFNQLDRLYGSPLGLHRLSAEIYTIDPSNEVLTQDEWLEVRAKDASYRHRCITWMRALIEGPSPRGISLAAEAATGFECDVFERYKYIENALSDNSVLVPNIGSTQSNKEFVIIPRVPAVTESERRRINRLVDRLRPVDSIVTITSGNYLRHELPVNYVTASSTYFNVQRLVTGNTAITWPPIDLTKGWWIDYTPREAPTAAFLERQESVTFLDIVDSSSTSEHIGIFNAQQRSLFGHLQENTTDPFYPHNSRYALALNVVPPGIATGWTSGSTRPTNTIMVNNYYPIDYFGLENAPQFTQETATFWASEEKSAPETDQVTFDLGRIRPTNFIDFQICKKPIDFLIEYDDNGIWKPIEEVEPGQITYAVDYMPSLENPWLYFKVNFNIVQTRYIRITFTRREQRFPVMTSDYFEWSIELRSVRICHLITNEDQYIADSGTDILGNFFETQLKRYSASYVFDNEPLTFWQSQPNPVRQAVESLYFDLRNNYTPGIQAFHNGRPMSVLDTQSQDDLESYYTDTVVIDEIYIDPITSGCSLHIYYSNDDTPDWDQKLWIPVPRDFILHRGFFPLPSSTRLKYVKLEFTNLAAIPYQPLEYPANEDVTYRLHPTWVEDYFNNVMELPEYNNSIFNSEIFKFDPLDFGFRKAEDLLTINFNTQRKPTFDDTDNEIKRYIDLLTQGQSDSTPQDDIERQIQFRSSVMWQDDLIQQLDSSRALTRKAKETRNLVIDTGWTSEKGLPLYIPPTFQSVPDLKESFKEKIAPILWFPRKCRHGYKVMTTTRDQKVAYIAAVREVSFHRRDFTLEHDDLVYTEILGDDVHTEVNDFFEDSLGRYVVER